MEKLKVQGHQLSPKQCSFWLATIAPIAIRALHTDACDLGSANTAWEADLGCSTQLPCNKKSKQIPGCCWNSTYHAQILALDASQEVCLPAVFSTARNSQAVCGWCVSCKLQIGKTCTCSQEQLQTGQKICLSAHWPSLQPQLDAVFVFVFCFKSAQM